jgi:hypothetical protein
VRLRRAGDRALAARGPVRVAFARVGRRSAPAIVWARGRAMTLSAMAWRRMVRVLTAVGDAGLREGRQIADRLLAGLPTASKDRRAILAAAGTLILVMGLSAGVLASRGAARLPLPTTTMAAVAPSGFGGTAVCQPPPVSESPADAAPAPSPPARAIGIGAAKPAHAAVKRRGSHQRITALATAKPTATAKPIAPAKPTATAKPLAPAKPIVPAQPIVVGKTTTPAQPVRPVAPAPSPAPARRPIFSR